MKQFFLCLTGCLILSAMIPVFSEFDNNNAEYPDGIATSDYPFGESWRLSKIGSSPGERGIEIAEQVFPYPEILFSRGYNRVAAIGFDELTGEYTEKKLYLLRYREDPFGRGMQSFHHQEIVPFGYDFLVAIEDNASVSIIDRKTGVYVRNQYDGVTSFHDSAVADFNRDGQPDILFATGQDIRIFDLINRFPIQSISCKSQKILIGQFDHDPSLEILSQTYPNLTLIDVDSGAEQQVLNFYAYDYFKADTDSDGIDEIICWLRDSASYSNSYIFAYDIDSMHLIWFYSHQKPDQIDLICTSSSLNENSCDVIFKYSTRERSTGSYRSQYTCLDGSTGSEIWTCSHENPYIMGMQLADTDRDGSKELIVLADEPSAIYIVDPATEEIEWKSDTFSDPVLAYDLADFDNDGIKDLVICQPVSKFSTSGCYTMLIYDAFSHALKDSIPLFTESKTTIGFATGDFHPGLSGEEYIVLTEDYGICTIRAFDSSHNFVIPEITWPGTGETVTGARFLAAMTDPRGNVVGPIDTVEFGWE